ncbi:hypothetical protein CFOL_v3_35502, partial [Cephalotus follicularis]
IMCIMAQDKRITLAIIPYHKRFPTHGAPVSDTKDSRLDNEVMRNFRTCTARNHQVMYQEEVVMNDAGTVSVIRSMENQYELVMVGRSHDTSSPHVAGITD